MRLQLRTPPRTQRSPSRTGTSLLSSSAHKPYGSRSPLTSRLSGRSPLTSRVRINSDDLVDPEVEIQYLRAQLVLLRRDVRAKAAIIANQARAAEARATDAGNEGTLHRMKEELERSAKEMVLKDARLRALDKSGGLYIAPDKLTRAANEIAKQRALVASRDAQIVRLKRVVKERDDQLKEKDAQLAEARYGGAPLGSTPGAKRGWVELRPGTAVWVARDSFIALYAGEGAQDDTKLEVPPAALLDAARRLLCGGGRTFTGDVELHARLRVHLNEHAPEEKRTARGAGRG